MQDQYGHLKRNHESAAAIQSSKLAGLERQVIHLQNELVLAQTTAQERATKVNQLQEQLDDLEEAHANTTSTSIFSENGGGDQWAIVRDELKRQTQQLRETESANTRLTVEVNKLRARNQNIEILKEEKRDLERKLARMEEVKAKVTTLEGELEAASIEKQSWSVPIILISG